MKFVISSSVLSSRLMTIGRVIVQKNTIPILDCFCFDIQGTTLTITASDNDTTLTAKAELNECDSDVRFAVNAKTLQDAIKEIPDQLINDRIDVLVDGLKAELKSSNYSLKDYLSAYGIEDEDALREQYKSSCESTVKVFLVADAIAAEKKIAVTDDDIKEYFNGEDTAQYEKLYAKPYLNRVVLNDLVLKEIEKTTTVK